jgi:hypothetical protein
MVFIGEWKAQTKEDTGRAASAVLQALERVGVNVTPQQVRSSVHGHTPEELLDLATKAYAYYDSIVSKRPVQWKYEAIAFGKEVTSRCEGNLLLLVLTPAVRHASELSFRCRACQDALITTLGLLRYQHDRGDLPKNLQELLAAGYVEYLPIDPYSDRPLVYRPIRDDFTLYTIGADFDDDGGQCSKWGQEQGGGDYVFWPVSGMSAQGGQTGARMRRSTP